MALLSIVLTVAHMKRPLTGSFKGGWGFLTSLGFLFGGISSRLRIDMMIGAPVNMSGKP